MSNGQTKTDVILIGAGIMSATLGSLLKEIAPNWEITVFERRAIAGRKAPTNGTTRGRGIPPCAS